MILYFAAQKRFCDSYAGSSVTVILELPHKKGKVPLSSEPVSHLKQALLCSFTVMIRTVMQSLNHRHSRHRCCWRIEIKPQLSEQRQKRE
jgi:hypothetical protein